VIFVGEELTAFVFVRSEYEKTLRTTGLNKTCYVILQVYSTLEEVNRLDSQKIRFYNCITKLLKLVVLVVENFENHVGKVHLKKTVWTVVYYITVPTSHTSLRV